MRMGIGRDVGLLTAAIGVVAFFGASLPGSVGVLSGPQTHLVHNVSDHSDRHHDTAQQPDKSEPTRSGLPGAVANLDLARAGAAVNDLAGAASQVVVSPNHMIIQGDSQQVAQGQTGDMELTCPAPFQVVNGGSSNSGTWVRLTKNFPVTTSTSSGWHVRVRNDDPGPRYFRAYAVCINGLTHYERLAHQNLGVAAGTYREDRLDCPAGMSTLGGGYSLDTDDHLYVNSSSAYGGPETKTWRVNWYNWGAGPAPVSAYAICAQGPYVEAAGTTEVQQQEYGTSKYECINQPTPFAGGWSMGYSTGQLYLVLVTDSYPTSNGHVVWAHNKNGSNFQAEARCGTVP